MNKHQRDDPGGTKAPTPVVAIKVVVSTANRGTDL
jgi:hypothetical protein